MPPSWSADRLKINTGRATSRAMTRTVWSGLESFTQVEIEELVTADRVFNLFRSTHFHSSDGRSVWSIPPPRSRSFTADRLLIWTKSTAVAHVSGWVILSRNSSTCFLDFICTYRSSCSRSRSGKSGSIWSIWSIRSVSPVWSIRSIWSVVTTPLPVGARAGHVFLGYALVRNKNGALFIPAMLYFVLF